jgi:site-specific recombinase XerD
MRKDSMADTSLTTIITSTSLDVAISGWLHEKAHLSNSDKTKQAYRDTLLQFRAWLQGEGLDLDSDQEEEVIKITLTAQAFASHSARDRQVRTSTSNQRLAILSSFYEYAKRKKAVRVNPIDDVKRGKVQPYASARALDQEETQRAFQSINRETMNGKRDYALLALHLQTGRRLQEIVTLQLQHLTLKKGKITVSFEHCKGDEVMRDILPLSVSQAMLAWLHGYYGASLAIGRPNDARPVWVSLAQGGRNGKSYGQPLGIQAIADVCRKYLGTSKVHVTRHTFAHMMEQAGASVSEIQARLGHKSLATTGRYLAQLKQAENKHADTLAAMLGIE